MDSKRKDNFQPTINDQKKKKTSSKQGTQEILLNLIRVSIISWKQSLPFMEGEAWKHSIKIQNNKKIPIHYFC